MFLFFYNSIGLDDLGSVEGDNIMTIHEKLDYIMNNSGGNNELFIPVLSLYSQVNMRAGTGAHVPGDLSASCTFKINCEPYKRLFIESYSSSVNITGQKSDGSTETKTYTTAMDISDYIFITFSPAVGTGFTSGYVASYSTAVSVELNNITID